MPGGDDSSRLRLGFAESFSRVLASGCDSATGRVGRNLEGGVVSTEETEVLAALRRSTSVRRSLGSVSLLRNRRKIRFILSFLIAQSGFKPIIYARIIG